MKLFQCIAAALLAALVVSGGCGSGDSGTVRIGLQGPMTGDYAYEGKGFERAVRLLADQAKYMTLAVPPCCPVRIRL